MGISSDVGEDVGIMSSVGLKVSLTPGEDVGLDVVSGLGADDGRGVVSIDGAKVGVDSVPSVGEVGTTVIAVIVGSAGNVV